MIVAPASTSVAVTVYTAADVLTFSGTSTVAPEVMTGVSFTLVTVIATLLSTYNAPSEARTTM